MITGNHPESVKLFSIVLLVLGVGIIYGTARRWNLLVDPPRDYRFFFHNIIRENLGEEGIVLLNYIMGFIAVVSGILIFLLL